MLREGAIRFAIVVLLAGLWGCEAAYEGYRSDDPCYLGCPVLSDEEEVGTRWPWDSVSVDTPPEGPWPCHIWMRGELTPDLIRFGAGEVVFEGTRSDSDTDEDYSSDTDNPFLKACVWDPFGSVQDRVLRDVKLRKVHWLEGTLYPSEDNGQVSASDGYLVPRRIWKVIFALSGSNLRTVAIIVPRGASPDDDLCRYIVTIDEVEEQSGLDLFPLATDDAFEAVKGDLAGATGC